MSPQNYIGTSGWSYSSWRGVFYPTSLKPTQWLEFYGQFLDTVELNNTFYNLPKPAAVERWAELTPADFTFAVKGSRFITHMKKLSEPEEIMLRFFESIDALGDKTGPLLWQLPPGWDRDTQRLDDFLAMVPSTFRHTVELRNHNWLEDSVYDVLSKHNAAFCIYQLAGFETPRIVTADFVYVRLHGPGKSKYSGKYTDEELAGWQDQIQAWNSDGKDVYCYFDNDQHGYAVHNAIQLKQMLRGEQSAARVGLFG